MKKIKRTPENNQIAQLENETARLKKKIAKYEAIELKQNRFGLVWLDVPEAFENDVENKLPILEEVPKLAISSKDDKPIHLLIEGDNYHALTCLNYTHKGKVDIIYIDPPYNTGSDGFKYKDKRILKEYPDGTEVPKEHPLRHSYWLSFMQKRLELARDILKDTGLIFISIDDNELAQLKLLCDEIFVERNFVNIIIWKKTNSPKAQAIGLGNQHEYVLMYAKDITKLDLNKRIGIITNEYKKMFSNNDNDGRGLYRTIEIEAHGIQNNENRKKFKFQGRLAPWLYSKKTLENWWKDGRIYISKTGRFRKKEYLNEIEGRLVSDLWVDEEIKPLQGASSEYLDFATQKPISLIKRIIKLCPNSQTVLDFFAGSGTTGQAVMELNEEDKGNRQFILITNNDEVTNGKKHKIMTDACYPRIKNAIKGHGSKKSIDNSVRYFKTAFVGKNNILKATDEDKIELAHNAGGMLAIAENTFERVEENNYWQIFENKKQYTAIYFREEFDKFDDFVERVRRLNKPVIVYIFSWEKEFEFNEFEDDKNIKVKTIPQPILEIYKQIYNLV